MAEIFELLSKRIAVLGWGEAAERLVPSVAARADWRLVGVADQRGIALVRARRATGAACFQHPAEMLRRLDYDLLLIDDPEASELGSIAASRGADLLVAGESMPAAALEELATAAVRHGGTLTVFRPLLRSHGVAQIAALGAVDAGWRPSYLAIDVQDEHGVEPQLRDAIALAMRLIGRAPERVTAAASGDREDPAAISVQLRFEDGALATIAATSGVETLRLRALAPNGELRVETIEGNGELASEVLSAAGEKPTTISEQLTNDDLDAIELEQVLQSIADGDAEDLRSAHRDAAVLGAVESALITGQTHHVGEPDVRSTLQLIEGGAGGSAPRRGRLHIVPTADQAS